MAFCFGSLLFHALYRATEPPRDRHRLLYVSVEELSSLLEELLENGVRFVDPRTLGTPAQPDGDDLWCLLSFDDGYFNNLYALETLERLRITALLYCVREQVERRELFWWEVYLGQRIREAPFERIYAEIQTLKRRPPAELRALFEERFGPGCFAAREEWNRPLTEAEIRGLAGHPFLALGAHGVSHRLLTGCRGAELEHEVSGAKDFLEALIGEEVAHFSYPNGNCDAAIAAAAARAGFRTGATVESGVNCMTAATPAEQWFLLRRTPVPRPGAKGGLREQVRETMRLWRTQRDACRNSHL